MSIIDRLFGSDEDPGPTYVCTGCGKAFEDERKICPDCGSDRIVTSRR